mmetsp:Transcript_25495/g.59735  ORF Transcript_25495/g.59735 Transcript_25495/m.59735 type:complete len:80 (+) Transcript_25495:2634-2873(+)
MTNVDHDACSVKDIDDLGDAFFQWSVVDFGKNYYCSWDYAYVVDSVDVDMQEANDGYSMKFFAVVPEEEYRFHSFGKDC